MATEDADLLVLRHGQGSRQIVADELVAAVKERDETRIEELGRLLSSVENALLRAAERQRFGSN